jgi:hypothetical protein
MAIDLELIIIIIIGLLGGVVTFFKMEWGLFALVLMIYTRLSDVLVNYHGLPSLAKVFVPAVILAIGGSGSHLQDLSKTA